MKSIALTKAESPYMLQQQNMDRPLTKDSTWLYLRVEQLLQLILRHPRTFILVYSCGPAMVALWLFSTSIQHKEWIWVSIAGSWLVGIVICVGGVSYLLSSRDGKEA
ncbi:MAG: hypothetical protein AAF702_21015 [Chloroflexota bacterium]